MGESHALCRPYYLDSMFLSVFFYNFTFNFVNNTVAIKTFNLVGFIAKTPLY